MASVEQVRLLPREARDVGFAPQPLGIGVAAHHSGRRAGNIREDAVERTAIPPLGGNAGVSCEYPDRVVGKLQAREVVADAGQPRLVRVERNEVDVDKLGQVRRLAAGRRAGVEHALSRFGLQQRRRKLGAEILHRERSLDVSGQSLHGPRPRDDEAGLAGELGLDSRGCEGVAQRFARADPPIHAQRDGGRALPASRIACQSSG
jgi:hypothetical protein